MEAMEIDSDTQKSKKPAHTIIFDYVMKWKGSRYTLARHLEEAGFNDASSEYVYYSNIVNYLYTSMIFVLIYSFYSLLMGKFQSPSPHCPSIKKVI